MGCCGSNALAFLDKREAQFLTSIPPQRTLKYGTTMQKQKVASEEDVNPQLSRAFSKTARFSHKRSTSVVSRSHCVAERFTDLASLYRIESSLGEGSFGKVSRAINLKTGHACAIKSIRYDNISLDRVEALFREVNFLRELDHPYIIKIYEVVHEEQYLHIITELCTGGELFDRLVSSGTFTEGVSAQYMHMILTAVNYLHLNSIVHCDIKPENMLFADTSVGSPLKLIDFGTSQICDPVHKLDQVAGTPYYIAPEILKGDYDEKCDIWSCGVVLFMMLSGKPPFAGRSREELFGSILTGKYYMDGPEWAPVSQEAQDLVKRMLTMDPALRPSAREVLTSPWFTLRRTKAVLKPESVLKSMKNLAKFKQREGLRQAVLTYISSQMSSDEEAELRDMFISLDENGDGKLSKEELQKGFSAMSIDIDVDAVLKRCDSDGNGYIEYTEFLTAAQNWRTELSETRLRSVFNSFDADGNGTISIEEFKTVIEDSDDLWEKVIKHGDKNGDGLIDYEEFRRALLRRRVKRRKKKAVRRHKSSRLPQMSCLFNS